MKVTTSYLKNIIIAILVCTIFLSAPVYTKTASGQSWQAIPHLPTKSRAEFIAVHPTNPNILFVGVGGELYATFNHGKDWKRLIGLGPTAKINGLHFDKNRIFLLTSKGLFESKNDGKNWKKNFSGRNSPETNARSLRQDSMNPKVFYLGTEGGLFQSRDSGRTWQKVTNELAHQLIRALEIDPENQELFIASEKGLYRIMIYRNQLDRIYITKSISLEEMGSDEEVGELMDIELSPDQDQIQSIIVAERSSPLLAIGTRKGVFISEDEGNHWERLPLSGLLSTEILDLTYSPKLKTFLAATEKGIFIYDRAQKRWRNLSDGFPLIRVNRLTLVSGETEMLYAATGEGAYQIIIRPELIHSEVIQEFPSQKWNLVLMLFQREPSISKIQKEAIRYANVSNWKTRRWQWASRLRAFIPTLSVGKSFSTSDTVDLDRGGTNDPDRYIIGPPDQNKSWDFDLNWNLSDLLWNSSQTSIDSREKLMVELRNDILSEATRLYFERRRAQVEFILIPLENTLERMNSLLRIDELTASIDALTNGYLTKELEKIYEERPEFREIWITPEGGSKVIHASPQN